MMNSRRWIWTVVVVFAGVGLYWWGVPSQYLLFFGLLVFCPLMMMMMMKPQPPAQIKATSDEAEPKPTAHPPDHRI